MAALLTTSLSGPAALISFTGLSTSYRFFELVGWLLKDANAGAINITLNNDTGANYDLENVNGSAATLSSARTAAGANLKLPLVNVDASTVLSFHATIAKPTAAQKAAGVVHISSVGGGVILNDYDGLGYSGAALISRIDVNSATNNLATGSRVALGGAKAA